MNSKTINIKGQLLSLDEPQVMGILNVTPDSFYAGSRKQTEAAIIDRIETILREGASIIDVGGYSSRPDAAEVSETEEMQRLEMALQPLLQHYPDVVVSVDTFRSSVARQCVEKYGVSMINDISGGELDERMFDTVAQLRVPYIMMHMRGTPQTMQQQTGYEDVTADLLKYFSQKLERLFRLGVNDVILDPGFGFSKTLTQNYELMRHLGDFRILGLPLLVGVSRKSMIYKLLETTPEESLNGTTVLHAYALLQGADILRVHDVRAAKEAIRIVQQLKG